MFPSTIWCIYLTNPHHLLIRLFTVIKQNIRLNQNTRNIKPPKICFNKKVYKKKIMFKVEYVKTPYFTSTQLSEVNRATNKSPKWWLFFLFFFFEWITPQKNFQPLPHNHCKHLHLPATCRVSRAEWQLQADARAALTCFHNTLLGYKKNTYLKKNIYIYALTFFYQSERVAGAERVRTRTSCSAPRSSWSHSPCPGWRRKWTRIPLNRGETR